MQDVRCAVSSQSTYCEGQGGSDQRTAAKVGQGMNIIIVSVILGAISLIALYWPKAKAGKGEIIVRLYYKDHLVLTGCAATKTVFIGGDMIVTEAILSNLSRDVMVDRVTLALRDFEELEVELPEVEPFEAYAHNDLTLCPISGELGILTVK